MGRHAMILQFNIMPDKRRRRGDDEVGRCLGGDTLPRHVLHASPAVGDTARVAD